MTNRYVRIMFSVIVALVFISISAIADPVTFTFTQATIDGKEINLAAADGHWIYLDGYRVKLIKNGMVDSTDPDSLGVFWAAMTSNFTTPRQIIVELRGQLCVGWSCADIVTGGTLEMSANGMWWRVPAPPQSYTGSDGRVIYVNPITNQPRGLSATIDLNLKAATSEVPEPATLALLGLGLLGVASRIKKNKNT